MSNSSTLHGLGLPTSMMATTGWIIHLNTLDVPHHCLCLSLTTLSYYITLSSREVCVCIPQSLFLQELQL